MSVLTKDVKIKYYEDDIRRWEEYLGRIGEKDPHVEEMVKQLKLAVEELKK